MIIYEKPEFIQVSYRPDGNFILFDWSDFQVTLEEIQELHKKALALGEIPACITPRIVPSALGSHKLD